MTVDTQALEDTSTMSIESVLNQMPQFVPDNTQFDGGTNVASGAVTPGIASVNLRGIGANRTLVLIDGRRAQPVNASLIVDLNTIPSAAIERVARDELGWVRSGEVVVDLSAGGARP